jgi:hypothetical protein
MNEDPTEEGLRRYPPDGRYEGVPCTCKPTCQYNCKGECGCAACRMSYADFLSDREE